MSIFLKRFFQMEAAGGLCLIAAAILALLIANSPLGDAYRALLTTELGSHNLHDWINDGPMAVFFLLAGLELKRELRQGALKSRRHAALPAIAALGGMVVPCIIYLLVAGGDTALRPGWAIPAATDIAFALGVLSLLPRVPAGAKIFLTALAIIDDLGAVLIIGLFYSSGLNMLALAASAIILAGLYVLNRKGVQNIWAYIVPGILLWLAVLPSGLHPTLAGVALAAAIPLRQVPKLEYKLHGWVAFLILPLFALANAGLDLKQMDVAAITGALPMAILLGLWIGKPVGIAGGTWLAVRLNLGALPAQMGWRHVAGVAALGGIGFTMSLFIADLAFADADLQALGRLGVMAASLLAALTGAAVLRRARSL